MRNLFITTAIGSFILGIIMIILQFSTLLYLCEIVLFWSLILIFINWIEPKIKEANANLDAKLEAQEWEEYYPDQEF